MNNDTTPAAQTDGLLIPNDAAPDNASHRIRLRRAKNRKLFNKKRETCLSDLLRNLDILVYAELSTVYYLDCSFFRLFLRSFAQLAFLSPKPEIVAPPQAIPRPLAAILGINAFCFVMHAAFPAPTAGEATRGYLHGSIAMDFIGQYALQRRWPLLLLDVIITVLQVICFGIGTTQQRAKLSMNEPDPTPGATEPEQTIDHEERGQRASEHRPEDIELREMNAQGSEERTSLLRDEERLSALEREDRDNGDFHIMNAFYSGQAVVASLCLPRIIKQHVVQQDQTIASASGAAPAADSSGGTLGAALTRGGLGFRLRLGERIWRV